MEIFRVKEILKSVNNSEDKGRTNIGAYLYGLGDGGGGPTVPIIERLKRVQKVEGLPRYTTIQLGHKSVGMSEPRWCNFV